MSYIHKQLQAEYAVRRLRDHKSGPVPSYSSSNRPPVQIFSQYPYLLKRPGENAGIRSQHCNLADCPSKLH